MDPLLLVPAGLVCLVVFWPLAVLFGAPGAVAMVLLAAATPVAGHRSAKRRARKALGPNWRLGEITAAHFRTLPAESREVVRELAEHLDALWSSQAARTGWLTADKLHDAHSAVWQAALLLLGTADQHLLLRESAPYAELDHLVTARADELAGVRAVVRDVAGQLREAHAKVGQLDALITAEQERHLREQHIAHLETRLTTATASTHVQAVPPVWQDALDTVNAHVEGALAVLDRDN
ncbi:hypothetical protein AB0I60_35965 [Actinosynnema sp. NPDC050436]|uniref:hypothetical protein n=1 Tax=Actinosynnema sp. NPDC050436 TaxID=3155659 RepID=UPI0033DCAA7F